ncbi:MAG: flagellar basal body protein, partial [bacterium]
MSNLFSSINTGLRALQTQKKSLDTTGHNIANANNEDYSRQKAVQSATEPHPPPAIENPVEAGQIGTGVKVSEIKRMRDEFIDTQIREE